MMVNNLQITEQFFLPGIYPTSGECRTELILEIFSQGSALDDEDWSEGDGVNFPDDTSRENKSPRFPICRGQ